MLLLFISHHSMVGEIVFIVDTLTLLKLPLWVGNLLVTEIMKVLDVLENNIFMYV